MRDHDLSAWSRTTEAILQELSVDPACGLDTDEVLKRQRTCGRNELVATHRRHGLSILLAQFKSIVVILLFVAGALAFLFSDFAEGLAIFAVIIASAAALAL